MTPRAVVCDLDGTLLNPDHSITPSTAETIRNLAQRGIYFIVATGRPYIEVFATIKKNDLHPDYIITSNGARVHDKNLELVFSHDLDPAASLQIFQLSQTPHADGTLDATCAAKEFVVNVNRHEEWLTDKCLPEIRKAFDLSIPYQEVDPTSFTVDDMRGTHSMWLFGDHSTLTRVQKYASKAFADTITTTFSLPYIIDCHPINIHKGRAVEEVCQLLQIPLGEVISFGDGMNDATMLSITGKACIMANAPQTLRDAVPQAEVIGSNADDGVARKLRELFSTTTDMVPHCGT